MAIPVLIPWAIVSTALSARRLRYTAQIAPCPNCGQPLGERSVALADEAWRDHVAALHRLAPGVRLRLIRFVQAICPGCGTQLRFDGATGHFSQTSQKLLPKPPGP